MTRIISIVGGLQPSTPTIGTATDGGTGTSANVAFTASSYIGKGTITYTATSSPGGFTGTGSSSPITVSGLTTGTAYTFTVVGTTNYGVASLSSGSSNSVTPANPDSGSMFLLGSITATSSLAQFAFSNIPSTYKHLQLRGIVRNIGGATGDNLYMRFNGDTSSVYSARWVEGNTSAVSQGSVVPWDLMLPAFIPTPDFTINTFSNFIIDILDYSDTNKFKTHRTLSGTARSDTGRVGLFSGIFRSTSAISSITFNCSNSFVTGSSIAVYGIEGA
jgi:hypothetical protein